MPSYVALQGGWPKCFENSNGDQVECGSERGWAVGLEAGAHLPVYGRLSTRLGLGVANSRNNLHGLNRDGTKQSADHLADNVLNVTSFMVNVAPKVELWGPISLYAMGGIGAARLAAFDHSDWAFAYQYGAGLVGGISESWSARAGYHWLRSTTADINGYEAEADLAGPLIEITYEFGIGS